MAFFWSDVLGIVCGSVLALLVLLCAGTGLARLARQPHLPPLALAFAVLPVCANLGVRWLGLLPALLLLFALAAWGAPHVRRRVSRGTVSIAVLWLLIVIYAYADVDWQGRLYQPLTILDTVKHAATLNSISLHGLPLVDPFFHRSRPAGYYHYFYTLAALLRPLTFSQIDARCLMAAMVFCAGAAFLSWVQYLVRATGLVADASARLERWSAVLIATSGLDSLMLLLIGAGLGIWMVQPDMWNEEIVWLLTSLIWQPHHVSALIAGSFGLLLLAEKYAAPAFAPLLLAGCAFASAFGLSVWVTLPCVLAALLWLVQLLLGKQIRPALLLGAAGGLALLLSIPQIQDILANRADAGAAIAFDVRPNKWTGFVTDPWLHRALNAALLPLVYAIEFGAFLIAGLALRRQLRATPEGHAHVQALLLTCAAAGLFVGTFFQSTLINNDLGWRAMLWPQLSLMVFTLAYVLRTPPLVWPRLLTPALILGLGTTLWTLGGLRGYPLAKGNQAARLMNSSPALTYQLRQAYVWAGQHLPPAAILQHNVPDWRAFDFGLYGLQGTAVADAEATLFGAGKAAVLQRIRHVKAIFAGGSLAAQAARRLQAEKIDFLVVTSADPLWHQPHSWAHQVPPVYQSSQVRIIATHDIRSRAP